MLEDSNPVSGKDCGVHSTLAFPCLEVAAHSSTHFPTTSELGRDSSYDVQLSALYSQMVRPDLTKIQGTHSTYWNAAAVVAAIVGLRLQRAVFEHQYSVVEELASAALLVPP